MVNRGIYRMNEDGQRVWAADLPEHAARYDAIVVGGGTAGAVAAVALADSGAKVLVVERLNCLGGVATAGGITGYYFGSRGGLYEQLDAETKAYEPLGYPESTPTGFDGQLKKRVLENRLWADGAEIAYEADLTGVLMDGNKVVGVEYACDSGLKTAFADVVVDATAEAYVCLLAGAQYELGRSLDNKVQPYGNVRRHYDAEQKRVRGNYTDCGYVNPTDPAQYSQAVMNAPKFSAYLRPDYRKGPRLVEMTQLLGMREGPLVEGDVRLHLRTIADGGNARENVLFTAYSNADNHGKDMAFENRPQQDWMIACSLWGLNFCVNVPVGAILPKGIDGLVMAGRMISIDHDLASCIRMERDVQKCGEAAGLLAAEAIARRVPLREVPYEALAVKLRRSGCLLPQNNIGFVDSRKGKSRVHFPETLEAVLEGLASDEPGMAIWQARRLPDKTPLYEALASEQDNLRIHAAMALALADDGAGADILLDCVRKRDSFVPVTSRKFNMIRGAAALYLLGRLAWKPALNDILSVISGWQTIEPENFKKDEFLGDVEEYRFQYFSQAVSAAMNIAHVHPETRAEIDSIVHKQIDRPDFSIFSTLKGPMQIKYQMAPMIRNAVACYKARRA